jgi:two-component system LytT family sensor kinase
MDDGADEPLRILRLWLWSLPFWLLLALVYAGQEFLTRRLSGLPLDWSIYLYGAPSALAWIVTTPLLFYVCQRIPIERTHMAGGLLKHAVIGTTVALAQVAFTMAMSEIFWSLVAWRTPGRPWNPRVLGWFLSNFLVYFLLVGAAHALRYYSRYRAVEIRTAQLEARLAEARLASLQMQLQPHFLFNVHHAIVGLIMKRENDQAIAMLTRLSDLLRRTLESANDSEVPLDREIETLRLYLEIQQIRFGSRLTVEFDIDPAAAKARVPNMALQPVVENAIKHGLERMATDGRIEISAHAGGGALTLQVRDNGPGLAPGAQMNGKGLGLTNVRKRLEQLYGSAYRMEIESPAGEGVTARLEIPLAATPRAPVVPEDSEPEAVGKQ